MFKSIYREQLVEYNVYLIETALGFTSATYYTASTLNDIDYDCFLGEIDLAIVEATYGVKNIWSIN